MLSPHYDDAPLSLGQSLHDGTLAKHTVTVGVVFGRSNWTRWFHPTRSRWPLASGIRLGEEARNALRFRYRVRLGGLEESILRTGDLSSESFLDGSFVASESEALDAVSSLLGAWAPRYDLVIAPLGIGDHVDHQLVAEAARRLMEAGTAVAFYEDRPYACVLDEDALALAAAKIDPGLERRPVSGPMDMGKYERIWYPSQFDDFYLTAISIDIDNAHREHVWVRPDSPWPTIG